MIRSRICADLRTGTPTRRHQYPEVDVRPGRSQPRPTLTSSLGRWSSPHAQRLHARQRSAGAGRDRQRAGVGVRAPDLGRSGGAHRRRETLDRRAVRARAARGHRRRRPGGVRPLLRGRQRRVAHPLGLPDRRREPVAQRAGRVHPQGRRAALGACRGSAGVPAAAHARPPHSGADRRRQGRAAQALRRRCRVLGRRAGGHLRQPRGGRQRRAQAGGRRQGRRARRWPRSRARKT